MKLKIAAILLFAVLAGVCFARPRPVVPLQTVSPPVALYILRNPGKEGDIWSIGVGHASKVDFNRRIRVRGQAEAESGIALMLETAKPNSYVFVGQIVI
jgi:hypothetical protein